MSQIAIIFVLGFVAGLGWGQWNAERQIRAERKALEHNRMTVSMPTNPEDAATTLKLLSALVEEAESKRQEAAQQPKGQP